ncbi:ATPase, P-type (transporting), HAD superfamily, subfamily IC/heavy metal translocating P-type ATPase [Blastococcus aggregatus]|uniref:ATPase, P-type (Transporting), HAD superfamily, subfamily IC/heavy metal translocating P-type ATPase n=2 Tax=Blastococcus aggregatus TaxID=38502 RepID=A0A285VAA1_9ACTN|nr:ATPase, P-type (transporting), HAD superfamily, subfamily IC/heavy metal translocating P-type ATPase [Blastococcus aggregatus]
MSSTLSSPPRDVARATPAGRNSRAQLWGVLSMAEVRWAAAAAALFALGGAFQLAGAPPVVWWTLYLACYVTGGWEPALAGLRALREKTLDVDLLMIVAALAAAAIGQVFDGALLIVIFATSGALEAFVTRRTADSVRALLDLAPERATRLDGADCEEIVDTAELAVGDVVLVRPGERVGADGEVLEGVSEVDQASITGEPLPVLKESGDRVFAGTLNGTGALRIRVDRAAADSVVARIVTMVEEASATKARTQLFIEKVEQRYSVGIVVATLALVGIPLAAGAAFEPTLLRAMTFMIVASPCAVVLATMPPLLSAIANAGRHGLLVKSAVVMEKFREITIVAFDKTGTLTEGTPRVAEIRLLPGTGLDADELLALAAAAERPSEHPLARAVVAAAAERRLELAHAQEFSSAPGRGVTATVDRQVVRVGSPALLRDSPAPGGGGDPAWATVTELEAAGRTAVVVLVDDRAVGVLGLADRLRPDAQATVRALTALTGATPVLLTGDNPGAARRLAEEVGITDVRAGLLPADKVAEVQALQAAGHRVLLVGDGVNDAPAMATADLGVAMGRHGSDLALETADAIVVRDELAILPKIIDLSGRAHRVVKANLIIAATVITVLVTWDLLWLLPLPLGVAGHEGSTVLVGLNGLRLLPAAAWRRAGRDAAATPLTTQPVLDGRT